VATKTTVSQRRAHANAAVAGDTTNYIKINGVKLGAICGRHQRQLHGPGQQRRRSDQRRFQPDRRHRGLRHQHQEDQPVGSRRPHDYRRNQGNGATRQHRLRRYTTTNTYGGIKLTSTSSAGINLGGADLAKTALTAGHTAATATFGAGIASVDLTTASGAQNAIATIDSALANINSSRANLGAVQNRFSSVVSNLATTSENLSASRSRIVDADFAAETANLTRSQILQQAGTAMLAQANSLPQNVLSLLRG
jgi:flagellin-like hook-associated protein FlgL